MKERTPPTGTVRQAFAKAHPFPRITDVEERYAEFDRWLEQVKAEAWDEGFADGVNHDLGDWENAPSIINNPYRQEKDA